jgi:hypothetical protein
MCELSGGCVPRHYRERLALRRGRQRDKRKVRVACTLYKRTTLYNGSPVLVSIVKKDGRRHSKNCDMVVRCYIPTSSVRVTGRSLVSARVWCR